MGVGTATTKKVQSFRSLTSLVILSGLERRASAGTSPLRSRPPERSVTLALLMSNPTVPEKRLAKAKAKGRPT